MSKPPLNFWAGEVSERLKEPASKAGSLAKPGSWVQIPPSPPSFFASQLPIKLRVSEPFDAISYD
jgi:hypothetical protein